MVWVGSSARVRFFVLMLVQCISTMWVAFCKQCATVANLYHGLVPGHGSTSVPSTRGS